MAEIEKGSLDATGLRSDVVRRFMEVVSITFIATRNTPTCDWYGRPRPVRHFFGGDADNFVVSTLLLGRHVVPSLRGWKAGQD